MNFIYLFLSLFTIVPIALSQKIFWQQTSGPNGGRISTIGFLDSTIFVGGNGGLFKSSNDGENWIHIGLPQVQITKIVTHQRTVFTGTLRHGIFRSDDGGICWNKVNGGLPWYISIKDMIVKDTFVFAATEDDGIFRNTILGNYWQAINNGIDNLEFETLIVSNESIIASAAGSSGSGMFRSTDNGQSWARLDTYRFAWMAEAVCKFNNTLYASGFGNYAKVHVSTDDGLTWSLPSGATAPNDIIRSLFADQSGLYAGILNHGIFRSTNAGLSWSNISSGLSYQTPFQISGKGNTVFIGTFDGIYRTSNAGFSWQRKNDGLTNGQISCITSTGGYLFAGTLGSGLFKSSDFGQTWIALSLSTEKPFINDILSINDTLYTLAAQWFPFYGTVLMSSNFGTTWTERKNGIDAGSLRSITYGNGIFYVSSDYGCFKTINKGLTWTRLLNLPNNGRPNVASMAAAGSVVLAANGESRLYRSIDSGEHWTTVSVSQSGIPPLVKVAFVDSILFAGCSQVNMLFKSLDSGATWARVQTPLFNGSVEDITGNNGDYYVAVSGGGVISNAGDTSWHIINTGLINTTVKSIHYAFGRVWSGTDGAGVFRSIDSTELASQPLGMYPVNDAISHPITSVLSWSRSNSADSYYLQLSINSNFDSLLINDSTIVDTFYFVATLEYLKKYYWRVSAVNIYGRSPFSDIYSFTTSPPNDFRVKQNYPNPFNAGTNILIEVPYLASVKLVAYNVLGQLVATISEENLTPGRHQKFWNPSSIPSGIYFIRIEAPTGFSQPHKVLLLK